MQNLFTIVTAPIKAIWDAFLGILIDSGVTIGDLVLAGVAMAILIGVVTHLSVSGGRVSRLVSRGDRE